MSPIHPLLLVPTMISLVLYAGTLAVFFWTMRRTRRTRRTVGAERAPTSTSGRVR